jgi:hypothetical protein
MEPKLKKTASPWWIAMTYYLTAVIPSGIAGILIAYLIPIALGLPLPVEGDPLWNVIALAVSMVLVWPNVWYSARYVLKTYEIKDRMRVLLWAMVYYAFSTGGYVVQDDYMSSLFYAQAILPIVAVLVFYHAGKRYLIPGKAMAVSSSSEPS